MYIKLLPCPKSCVYWYFSCHGIKLNSTWPGRRPGAAPQQPGAGPAGKASACRGLQEQPLEGLTSLEQYDNVWLCLMMLPAEAYNNNLSKVSLALIILELCDNVFVLIMSKCVLP